jgi:20S proteasome subunit beta 3
MQSANHHHLVQPLLNKFVASSSSLIDPSLTASTDGGACVAMVGKDCVAIACDLRLGLQALTVSNNFPKIFNYGDVYLGLTGLATDVQTVSELFRYKVNMYRLREERQISPQTMANLVSSSLYEKRFGPYFISPVIAGINHTTGKPFICGFDSIGCIDFAKDFIVSGTASDQLFGTCEGLWEPDLVRTVMSAPARAPNTDIQTRALRTSSKPSHKLCSTLSTAMPSQVGEHTFTSSRRTRSPRDCSRVDRIRRHRTRCELDRGRQAYVRILYNTKEGIGIADGAQELKGRHYMRGCHVTSFLGSSHEISRPKSWLLNNILSPSLPLTSPTSSPFLICQEVAWLIGADAALSTN